MRAICTLLLAASAVRAQFPVRDNPAERNPLAGQPEAVEGGRKLFAGSCIACHGPNGEGGRGPNLAAGRRLRRLTDRALFVSIKSGIAGTDMPPTDLPDDQLWRLVAFVRSLGAPAYETRLAGDPDAGAAIFFGKGECSGCHMIRGRGGFLAPDLTEIGAERTAPQLRESILKPDARIAEGYEGVTVITKDGARIEGVARNNDNYSIQILGAKGELRLLSKDNVREIVVRKRSLMPDDYSRRLSPEEISNLVAFLGRQSVRPPGERSASMRFGR